jgi:hypothetical protein
MSGLSMRNKFENLIIGTAWGIMPLQGTARLMHGWIWRPWVICRDKKTTKALGEGVNL